MNEFHINGQFFTNDQLANILTNESSVLGKRIFFNLTEIAKKELQKESKSSFKWLLEESTIKYECFALAIALFLVMLYDVDEVPVELKQEIFNKMMALYYQSGVESEIVVQISATAVSCLKRLADEWTVEKVMPGGFNNELSASRMLANTILVKLSQHAFNLGSEIPKWNSLHLSLIEQEFQTTVSTALGQLASNPLTYSAINTN